MIRQLISQVLFLTRLPVPVKIDFCEDDLVKGVIYAPFAGLIIGSLLGGVYFLLNRADLDLLSVSAVVIFYIIITGGLHLDGLADTADGFFSYRPKDKVLQIMKDPHVGTNGILALIIVIILKITLLFSLDKNSIPVYLVIIPVISRMNIAWCAGMSVYAGGDKGMAKLMVERTGTGQIIASTLITLLIVFTLFSFRRVMTAAVLVVIAVIFAALVSFYSSKKIGGVTGDIIGAVIELTEIVLLIILLIIEKVSLSGGYIF